MNNQIKKDFYGQTSTAVEENFNRQNIDTSEYTKVNHNQEIDFETDDYSVNSNFKEETGYEIKNKVQNISEQETEPFSFFKPITIETTKLKDQKQVSLTKTRQKLYLGARLKMVLSAFVVIMASLMVAVVWNFAQLAKLNTSLLEKEITIGELENSISSLDKEYKLLDSEEEMKKAAEAAGYVEISEENTKVISWGEMYTEAKPTEVPSNWFNDVCSFLCKLFN